MKRNKLFYSNYQELLEILNCVNVGVWVTDGEGNTIIANDASLVTGGLTRDEVMGRNMRELESIGYVKESATVKVLETGKTESFVQYLGNGEQIFITGCPFYRNGEIEYILCTERDTTEIAILKDVLVQKEETERKYEKEIAYLRDRNIQSMGDIVTCDFKMRDIIDTAIRAAKHDTTVLLMGESGTGKELFANMIYRNSSRMNGPFIKINCAAIPVNLMESEFFGYDRGAFTNANVDGKTGYFELADKGTLFLDEIGELPLNLQPKILRAIQEKEIVRIGGKKPINVDVRIIAATNSELEKKIANGTFRRDLYYRLHVMPIKVPPLRERPNDIPPLVYYFMEEYSKKYRIKKRISEDALTALKNYDWPGNVRELENIIEHIFVRFDGEEITRYQVNLLLNAKPVVMYSEHFSKSNNYKDLMELYEKALLTDLLGKHQKASVISAELDINKSTLSRKLKKYGLSDWR